MKTELEKEFEEKSKNLAEIRAQFSARVARWIYSSEEIWSWEDRRQKRGFYHPLPSAEGALYACGVDASNQPIVLQMFDDETDDSGTQVPTKEIWEEQFITHNGDNLELMRFVWGRLKRLVRMKFAGHRLIEEKCVIEGYYRHTLIHYEGGKDKLYQTLNTKGQVFYEIERGPRGKELHFRVRRDGSRFQLYQPLPKGIKIKGLKGTVKERMVALIPELVAAAEIREPIYCVALAYDDEGNDSLPPMIGIGMESERSRWKTQHGKRARDFVWNPAEFKHYQKSYTELSDEALEEACDYLNSKWAEGDSAAPAAKLLEEAAAALCKTSWPASVQRTDDFVVYAIGLEGSGLRRSLKTSLTPDQFAALKAQRLL